MEQFASFSYQGFILKGKGSYSKITVEFVSGALCKTDQSLLPPSFLHVLDYITGLPLAEIWIAFPGTSELPQHGTNHFLPQPVIEQYTCEYSTFV